MIILWWILFPIFYIPFMLIQLIVFFVKKRSPLTMLKTYFLHQSEFATTFWINFGKKFLCF